MSQEKPKVFTTDPNVIESWPLYHQDKRRNQLMSEIVHTSEEKINQNSTATIEDLLEKTIYLERQRVKNEPWKVDPPNEALFWNKAKNRLEKYRSEEDPEARRERYQQLAKKIIQRYTSEILGSFNKNTFLLARKILTVSFKNLYGHFELRDLWNYSRAQTKIKEQLIVDGPIEHIRHLFSYGTVIVLPTHSSNMDSILVGYMLDMIGKMPAFSYGAGLNLYNNGSAAYFMNRLGAYRVDRRKKNPIYLDTLKNMSSTTIEDGVNTIFFPGGTRSREGSVETKLKLGLVGSVIDAQRACIQKGLPNKIFIVPLVINYETVLEAGILIEQFLRRSGKDQYIPQIGRGMNFLRAIKFGWKLIRKKNRVYFSFGKPIDVFTNEVDEFGNSYDKYGNQIDIKKYYEINGTINQDSQRESEYTKRISAKMSTEFLANNVPMPHHILSKMIIHLMLEKWHGADIFDILKLPAKEWKIPMPTVMKCGEDWFKVYKKFISHKIFKQDRTKKITDFAMLLEDAIENGGAYHRIKLFAYNNKSNELIINDLPVIYFYSNRMEGYDMQKEIIWKKYVWDEEPVAAKVGE